MYALGVLYQLIKLFPSLIFSELLFLVKYSFQELSIEIEEIENYLKSMISLLVISSLIKRETLSNGKIVFNIVNDMFSCFKFKNSEIEHLNLVLLTKEITERKSLK